MVHYTTVILLAFFGFLALAALLLVPVYRFLKREEQLGEQWTREVHARRRKAPPSPNGAPPREGPPD